MRAYYVSLSREVTNDTTCVGCLDVNVAVDNMQKGDKLYRVYPFKDSNISDPVIVFSKFHDIPNMEISLSSYMFNTLKIKDTAHTRVIFNMPPKETRNVVYVISNRPLAYGIIDEGTLYYLRAHRTKSHYIMTTFDKFHSAFAYMSGSDNLSMYVAEITPGDEIKFILDRAKVPIERLNIIDTVLFKNPLQSVNYSKAYYILSGGRIDQTLKDRKYFIHDQVSKLNDFADEYGFTLSDAFVTEVRIKPGVSMPSHGSLRIDDFVVISDLHKNIITDLVNHDPGISLLINEVSSIEVTEQKEVYKSEFPVYSAKLTDKDVELSKVDLAMMLEDILKIKIKAKLV
ncbi:hypothetical protein KNT64_gp038 [Pseudomonas phage PspYZU05]|uniref:Uncharacterized protein n=1 Tax=Pseudomonas phage PspYZU05 TaxID=1983556 RepID=A0A2U7N2D5_9CAUD|nr:hypothetical protein KNT64_gp038 [Pseudomonas phage PspYZU05]ASD51990.1 hypothetical protein PspYZU05_38 [Pseudomonas phage PspYZU05]